jgi:hypothetical protein
MPPTRNTTAPHPYQSRQNELLHSGIVTIPAAGSLLVDLGIGHNNFVPSIVQQASLAADVNKAAKISWAYGTRPGTFTIYAWKATAAGTTTLIAATAAVVVSFTVIADSSVG